jgi:zinc transport system substrate-binding protein
VWLSPRILRDAIAPAIADALIQEAPEFAETYKRNLGQVQQTLTALDERIARQLAPLRGRTFYTYHAAFGHFARTYGLRQESIELDGKSPSPRRINELIERARAEGVRVIFVQKQFPSQSARAIAEAIDGAVVPLNPLGRDYIQTMEDLAAALERGLRHSEAP